MSKVIKATYVRLDAEPVHLETPELLLATTEDHTLADGSSSPEDEIERQISELVQARLKRIQEMERALEEQREQQSAEIAQTSLEEQNRLQQLRLELEEELAVKTAEALESAAAEGHQRGLQVGREEAFAAAAAATTAMREQAEAMLREAALEADKRLLEGERNILELVFAVATKVLEREIIEREEATLELIRIGLQQFRQVPQVLIKVPQDRYQLVQGNLSRLKEEFRQVLTLDCIADPSLPLTDITIDSPFGMVDVRYDSQLEILHQELLELLRNQG